MDITERKMATTISKGCIIITYTKRKFLPSFSTLIFTFLSC